MPGPGHRTPAQTFDPRIAPSGRHKNEATLLAPERDDGAGLLRGEIVQFARARRERADGDSFLDCVYCSAVGLGTSHVEVSALAIVRFTIPLPAAHAFVEAMISTRLAPLSRGEQYFEFEDTNAANETRIGCSVSVAKVLLEELQRIRCSSCDDELSFALSEGVILVRHAIAAAGGS